MGAWGSTPWGGSGWGGPGLGDGLQLDAVQPIAENVVRLAFNRPVRFTRLLDPFDGSNVEHYAVTADSTTLGADSRPPRAVRPILAELALGAGAAGRLLDLTVDRCFGPYPGRYRVAVAGLRAITGEPLTIGFTSQAFDGLAMARQDPSQSATATAGDFDNPQTVQGLGAEGLISAGAVKLLGTFPIDGSGDYGIDRGLKSYKKRVIRRLSATQGSFAHLAASRYGVGVVAAVKTLARASTRESLAAEAATQIRLEPETKSVKVTVELSATTPGVVIFLVRIGTYAGEDVAMDVPFSMA